MAQCECKAGLQENVNIYKVAETLGLGIITGFVWWGKGGIDTQTALGEQIGILFFTCALWTVPPVFQGLAAADGIVRRGCNEYISGMYHINALVFGTVISSILTSSVWCCVWQILAYTMADIGASWQVMLAMHGVVVLNFITMRCIGWFLGLVCPSSLLNTVIGNLFAQMCMLTNGFYTKLPSFFDWVTVFSVPRYTLRALLKLEYTWHDGFLVHPTRGVQSFGYPTKYIPAELTGVFQLLHERNMQVMESPHDSSIMFEVLALGCYCLLFLWLFSMVLMWRVRQMEESPRTYAKNRQEVVRIKPDVMTFRDEFVSETDYTTKATESEREVDVLKDHDFTAANGSAPAPTIVVVGAADEKEVVVTRSPSDDIEFTL